MDRGHASFPAPSAASAHGLPSSWGRRVMCILWSAFLVAGVQEALVFVVVDPQALHWFGADPITWSTQAIYTVTFLIFWVSTATAGALAMWLYTPDAV
jgi:hypothetical protein